MVKHIVMWKLKDFSEGNDKESNAKIIKAKLEGLKGKIEQIKDIEVGINMNASNLYDVVLYSEFDNMEDLEIYQKHPLHLEVGAFVGLVKEERASVDYTI